MGENQNTSQIILYRTEDGQTKLQVKMEDETVWLTQDQMAGLFEKSKSTINEHIKNIYEEKELDVGMTMRKFGISEFSTKPTNYYNLDVVISVGYRVKSVRGTQFRIWATQRLKEYIIKGFALDDERLKHDTKIAKNYLTEEELKQLNLIVSLYLDFAELQATNGRLMKMADWAEKLDQFIHLSERGILTHAGTVSADDAAKKADQEFDKYRKEQDKNYISDFDKAVKMIEAKEKKLLEKKR